MTATEAAADRLHRFVSALRHLPPFRDAPPELYQTSTMAALLAGVYDGDVTVAELLRHGDFGLGTFDRLDGEMLVLGGTCYRLRADGSVEKAGGDELTPFAAVTRFRPERRAGLSGPLTRAETEEAVGGLLTSPNLVHAVRIDGHFTALRTRTVARQHRPYPPLAEATAGQAENTFREVSGTLAGFFTPSFEQGVSVAGYHLHFIDESRTRGGHSLDFTLADARVAVEAIPELRLRLPTTQDFLRARPPSAPLDEQIRRIENG
ncbi:MULTISPECIES: acetolactate decarboxylase [Streptomyces]|uniref:Alpha-acetolactate decarboxylase n=1 Tax=Streptomyces canarius TaxID=285453 RepID=A0ABQ3D6P6_9ACTN|nr:acetolactate decarboxylase [Streptomyces canarius]GHA61705.1 alpha-acetolactate decarboxylase [Streptomyces canarius]